MELWRWYLETSQHRIRTSNVLDAVYVANLLPWLPFPNLGNSHQLSPDSRIGVSTLLSDPNYSHSCSEFLHGPEGDHGGVSASQDSPCVSAVSVVQVKAWVPWDFQDRFRLHLLLTRCVLWHFPGRKANDLESASAGILPDTTVMYQQFPKPETLCMHCVF